MLSHKLILEEEKEDYQLLAIHSSLDEFKMAYLLNKHLEINMRRSRLDLDFNHAEVLANYPLYIFKEPVKYRNYYLIKNKYTGPLKKLISSGSLFNEDEGTPQITYLIPEFKEVDFFLKVEEDLGQEQLQKLINKIAFIPNVITIYAVDANQLKSKNNLILE